MNLILYGPPGAGKSQVGKSLAELAALKFLDTDTLIESTSGQSCRALFLQKGEESFRALEHQILSQLKNSVNTVIAAGGGTLLLPQNITLLKTLGPCIYLKVNPDVLYERMSAKGPRAFLDSQDPKRSFQRLLQQRNPIYSMWADLTINIETETPEQIAQQIWNHYGQ